MRYYCPNMIDFVVVLWILFTKYVDFIDVLTANLVYKLIVNSIDILILNMKC